MLDFLCSIRIWYDDIYRRPWLDGVKLDLLYAFGTFRFFFCALFGDFGASGSNFRVCFFDVVKEDLLGLMTFGCDSWVMLEGAAVNST